MHSHRLTAQPTFISAWNHRQLYSGEGYAGPSGTDVSAWESQAELRHGVGGSGWTDVYQEAVSSTTSRCYLGGDADFLFPVSREYSPKFRRVLFFDGLISRVRIVGVFFAALR